jgi:peptidoglycan/LPS O-acetylase OafA/YrhL
MRLRNLQALRGAACLLVVFAHLSLIERRQEAQPPILRPIDNFAFGAVDVLFVLSGFVITWACADALGKPRRLADFAARRLWRVYPVYWLCWLIALPLTHTLDFARVWFRYPQIRPMAPSFFAMPRLELDFVMPQTWTLVYELSFYAAFGLMILLPRRCFAPFLGVWATTCVAAILFPATAARWSVEAGYTIGWVWRPSFLEIVLGCFAALLVRRGQIGWGRFALAAAIGGFVAGAVAFCWFPGLVAPVLARMPLYIIPATLLVYAAVAVERTRGWVLPGWLQVAGDASFPIYLIHGAVFEFGHRHFRGTGPTLPGHLAWLALMAGAALAAGFAIHFAVERPLLNLARPRKRSPRAVTPAEALPVAA